LTGDDDAPAWGDPPVPDVVTALLAERYPLEPGERFDVDVHERGLSVAIVAPHHAIRLGLTYMAGAGPRDPWDVVVDAADALVGELLEGGRDHRRLPQGEGVLYEGARLTVRIEKDVPELSDLADRWLKGG